MQDRWSSRQVQAFNERPVAQEVEAVLQADRVEVERGERPNALFDERNGASTTRRLAHEIPDRRVAGSLRHKARSGSPAQPLHVRARQILPRNDRQLVRPATNRTARQFRPTKARNSCKRNGNQYPELTTLRTRVWWRLSPWLL